MTERSDTTSIENLHATVVAYSSTVGTSVMLSEGKNGRAVALILISIPDPALPYKQIAVSISDRITNLWNVAKDKSDD